MKRHEFQFEYFPNNPLIGIHFNQCEMQIEEKWEPARILELGFFIFKFRYINVMKTISLFHQILLCMLLN